MPSSGRQNTDSFKGILCPFHPVIITLTVLFTIGVLFAFQYEGGRSKEDFIQFLNEKCSTNRLPGGKLNEDVSVCPTFSSRKGRTGGGGGGAP